MWLWAVSSGLVLFRTASITGGVIFVLEYTQLAKITVEMKSTPSMGDWNVVGSDVEQKDNKNNNNHVVAVVPNNVTLPPFVLCADGRNVSSCHSCSVTNTEHASPCPSRECQWCPYGAVVDRSLMSMTPTKEKNKGVLLYDEDGSVRRVHDAHIPIGMQCVSSALQRCRAPYTTVWQHELALLAKSAVLRDMTVKAAEFTTSKPCRKRGYQFCPYGGLHAYHNLTQQQEQQQQLQQQPQQEQEQFRSQLLAPNNRPPQCIPKRMHCQPPDDLLVQPGDVLYRQRYGSAVIIPQFKLVFVPIPKVASSVWYQLFRRIMGMEDWQSDLGPLPHTPDANGLTYLADLPRSLATDIWTSPAWTKAIFVRNPKERLLSAYLDKVVHSHSRGLVQGTCCGAGGGEKARTCAAALGIEGKNPKQPRLQPPKNMSLVEFVDFVVNQNCLETGDHWNLQSQRMEPKYWPYIDFVGDFSTLAADAQRLLERVGAWQEYGAKGWGPQGNLSMFESVHSRHATDAAAQLRQYFGSPLLESKVDALYEADYKAPHLGLSKTEYSSQAAS